MRQAAGGSRREGRATVWQDEHQPISARPVKLCGGSRLLREPFREGGDEPGAQRIGQHHHVRLGTPVFGDAFGVAALQKRDCIDKRRVDVSAQHAAHGVLRPVGIGGRKEVSNLLRIGVGDSDRPCLRRLVTGLGGAHDFDGGGDVFLQKTRQRVARRHRHRRA